MSAWCADCDTNPAQVIGLCDGCYHRHTLNGSLDAWARIAGLPTVAALDVSWHSGALCAQVDPEIFFPAKGGNTRAPKTVCAACEVRDACLGWALATRQEFGIWGGASTVQRRRLLRTAPSGVTAA